MLEVKDTSEKSYPCYFSSERSGKEFEKKYMTLEFRYPQCREG